jgi:chemotaxis protein MotB
VRTIVIAMLIAACGPKIDPRIPKLEKDLADTKAELDKQKQAEDDLKKQDDELKKQDEELRNSDAELKAKADEAKALEAKLAEAVGKAGEVTTADGAVRLELVDQILFPLGEADLKPDGKEVLAKVGAALKDVDKQIWVQGHTDDTPIVVKKKPEAAATPPPPPPPAKGKKGGKAKPPEPAKPAEAAKPPTNDAVLAFVTNWELSAARALTVVHYLQDEAKLDPTRLAAVAFGQYRPVSKVKAKNRRIEIVLYPRAKISPK